MRPSGRAHDQLRELSFTRNYTVHAEGSVLVAFGDTKVLRGGAWTTRARMASPTYRNYFGPERRDVFAGFRTCAL